MVNLLAGSERAAPVLLHGFQREASTSASFSCQNILLVEFPPEPQKTRPCNFCASSVVVVTGIIVSNDPVNRWDLLGLEEQDNELRGESIIFNVGSTGGSSSSGSASKPAGTLSSEESSNTTTTNTANNNEAVAGAATPEGSDTAQEKKDISGLVENWDEVSGGTRTISIDGETYILNFSVEGNAISYAKGDSVTLADGSIIKESYTSSKNGFTTMQVSRDGNVMNVNMVVYIAADRTGDAFASTARHELLHVDDGLTGFMSSSAGGPSLSLSIREYSNNGDYPLRLFKNQWNESTRDSRDDKGRIGTQYIKFK